MATRAQTHARLGVAIAGAAIVLPRVFGTSRGFTRFMTTLAVGKLACSMLVRQRAGESAAPTKTEAALDVVQGVTACAMPFFLRRKENPLVTTCAVGLGVAHLTMAVRAGDARIASFLDTMSLERPLEPDRLDETKAHSLPKASFLDSLSITLNVFLANVAKGPIARRPWVEAAAEKMELDTIGVKTMQRMRAKYGNGPLLVINPIRTQAVILDPAHVRRVLNESPVPFATASAEKIAALAHFQPKNALISHGHARAVRRELNECTLETHNTVHPLATHFLPIVDEEMTLLLKRVQAVGELTWDDFIDTWFCIVRRIVFGNAAREDRHTTDLAFKLRHDANWAFFKPRRVDLRDELHVRIRHYLQKAEPNSLAAQMAGLMPTKLQAAEQQIPQWLFAFDPAAMATFRALALLATHPTQMQRAREEAVDGIAAARPHRPFLRATILESLRLWPTTPLILRQTTRPTAWEQGTLPAGAGVLIYTPFFHRDDRTIPFAHRFNPDPWIQDDAEVNGSPPRDWPFVPFSGGPAHCPGQTLVLLLGSGALASLIGNRTIRLKGTNRLPTGNLPGTLDHFRLRFEIRPLGQTVVDAAERSGGAREATNFG